MAKTTATGSPRDGSKASIVFEQRQGIYWLGCCDLTLAQSSLGIRNEGDRVGFERDVALLYAGLLIERRFRVGVRNGETLRYLSRRHPTRPGLQGEPVELRPEDLLDRRELERLLLAANRGGAFARLVQEAKTTVLKKELGAIYVYTVGEGWFEVDWELTSITERGLNALAVAAHELGVPITCQLVLPKPKRGRARVPAKACIVLEEPVTCGQLRLAF